MSTKVFIFSPLKPTRLSSCSPNSAFLPPNSSSSLDSLSLSLSGGQHFGVRLTATGCWRSRRDLTFLAATMLPESPVLSDICATGFTGLVALSVLRFWGVIAERGVFDQDICATLLCSGTVFAFLVLWQETARRGLDQKLNRKLVHISIGLVFMLCWPLFSSGRRGAILAALAPGVNIIRMLLLGLGIWKDEATVKSMSRHGDYRELLKGPLYYATTITLACIMFWRTSPVAIAAICNLCAGDGMADVIGRRFGKQKLPYNRNKSVAGSIALATSGFLASLGYMYYFASFGYIQGSQEMILGFLVVSLASAVVESLPISTELDDNLTVALTSMLLGSLVF